MRIVSLLPSATDIVEALGAADQLVGISHSCDVSRLGLPVLTSTVVDTTATSAEIDRQVKQAAGPLYDLDYERLRSLAPDVVISQSLCDVCAVGIDDVEAAVAALPSRPILVNLSPFRLADIPDDVLRVAEAIDRSQAADRWLQGWQSHFRDRPALNLRVAMLDWLDPPFAAGHWMPDLLRVLGCNSVLAQPGQPSHEITWQTVRHAQPDVVVAACCGLSEPRSQADAVPPDLQIHRLDGQDLFSRPSPALMPSLDVLENLLSRLAA